MSANEIHKLVLVPLESSVVSDNERLLWDKQSGAFDLTCPKCGQVIHFYFHQGPEPEKTHYD